MLAGFASDCLSAEPAYSMPATDPVVVERGRVLFVANGCTLCHGADARGGNGGPNLLRTQTVLRDRHGELIATPVQKGVPGTPMAGFPLNDAAVADIAEFLHSFRVLGADSVRMQPAIFTMGDSRAGGKYFARHCASCHQVDRDLKGLAARFAQPRDLQQHWLMPRNPSPTTASVTMADGTVLDGKVVRIDEFQLTLELPDRSQRIIERDGDVPRVTVRNPLSVHKALLPTYRDSDIHNVTAYLATLR